MQPFLKKKDAIVHLNKHNSSKIKLFGEDITTSGSKCYYVCPPEAIFEKIINNKDCHYYEFFLPNKSMVFGVDLDISKEKVKTYTEANDIVKESINIICKAAKEIYNFNYKISDFIVLENHPEYQLSNPKKFSYHIIVRGLEFPDGLTAKTFYKKLEDQYNFKYGDPSIYHNCLRLCYSSKMGNKAYLLPKNFKINSESTYHLPGGGTDEELFDFWCKTLMTNTEDTRFKVNKEVIKPTKLSTPLKIKSTISDDNLIEIINKLPEEFRDDYDKWIRIGMILHGCGKFEIWDDWSKTSRKYNKMKLIKFWDGFDKYNGPKLTIGSLIKIAQDLGIVDKKKNIKDIIEEYPEMPVEIRNIQNTTILNQAKLTPDVFSNIDNKKLVAIQSEKGTGKTSNLLQYLIDNKKINNNTSVLVLSSRRTLGIKFFGDLEKYGFELYSEIEESDIFSKKIICQVDSLLRLKRSKFDIIIIDECESLARYLTGSHFKRNTKAGMVVNLLECFIRSTPNLYILDADLSDRCMNYYTRTKNITENDIQLIINKYQPYKEYTIVALEYSQWLLKILDYLENKKKIVIAMASNNKAKDLEYKILDEYPDMKLLIIHRETSDDEKMETVKNVNDKWSEYDVIIYTPSVNMGISYDVIDNFDAIFGYGCSNSVAGQEFTQMLHRVRSPKEKNIYISVDMFRPYTDEDVLTYNQVEEIICSDHYLTKYDLHSNLMLPKPVYDENKSEIVYSYPYKDNAIYDLIVRNSKEVLENNQNFCTNFFGYIKHKGYTLIVDENNYSKEDAVEILEEMKSVRNKRVDHELELDTKGIVEARDLTEEEYLQKICHREDYLTDEDRYSIRKYNIKKCYNYKAELTSDFVEEYNDTKKMMWYHNLTTIRSTEEQDTDEKLEILRNNRLNNALIDNCYLDHMYKNTFTYQMYGIGIVTNFKFDIDDFTKTIDDDTYKQGLESCIIWLDNNKNYVCEKFKMRISTKKLVDYNARDQIKFINQILDSMYGLKITKASNKKNDTRHQLVDKDTWKTLHTETGDFKQVNLEIKYI